MKKNMVRHHLSQPINCLVSDGKKVIEGLKEVFSRSPQAWPFGDAIKPEDVREMVEDCNSHFSQAGIPCVKLEVITAGQVI